ncbi:MAG: hypothetical protein ABSC92_00400 [Rhizomicrobium sp.]|jgi:hypothetical protein
MRTLIGTPFLLVVLALGALYAAYGEVDPCRVLAVERARRAETQSGLPVGDAMERWSRIETSQLSTGECTSQLLDSWGERLSHHFR